MINNPTMGLCCSPESPKNLLESLALEPGHGLNPVFIRLGTVRRRLSYRVKTSIFRPVYCSSWWPWTEKGGVACLPAGSWHSLSVSDPLRTPEVLTLQE